MSKKKAGLIIIYLFFMIQAIVILPNTHPIQNRINRYTQTAYSFSECTFFNWAEEGTLLISQNDCQIIVEHDGSYVRNIVIDTVTDLPDEIKIYLIPAAGGEYSEENSLTLKAVKNPYGYLFNIDSNVHLLRIDLTEDSDYELGLNRIVLNPQEIRLVWLNAVPFLLGMIAYLCIRRNRYLLRDIYSERELIWNMAKNDLKSRYAGSVLGIIWAYIQPILTIVVMWYVFQVGFRNPPVSDAPYILWFIAGYIPWMFFNDGLINATNSLQEYSYLVKKIKFKVSTLPVIKLLSSLFIHGFFVLFIIIMFLIYGYWPKVIWLQTIYYSFALFVLLFGLGLIFSALAVIFKDCAQVVSVILQVLFWYTPIIWNYESLNTGITVAFKANPLFYIINGYRETFIYGTGCWNHPVLNIYYWGSTFIILIIGIKLFNRFKPHFSDLL